MTARVLYTTGDGQSRIRLRSDGRTVWLAQRQMAESFDVSTDNVALHLKNIYEDGELRRDATAEESSVVQIEGSREVLRKVALNSLDGTQGVPSQGLRHG